jgi:hypothetical protein
MPRVPRSFTVTPHSIVHKVWRGHNREFNLGSDLEKTTYLQFFNDDCESKKYTQGSTLAAITVMSNHCHEIHHIADPKLFSNHMRRHHARYGMFFNRLKERCGKVAQDRPHTTLIEDGEHEMQATFYLHANPVRAKIVKDARDYHFSTHKLYAFGKREAWMRNIKLPSWYLALGKTQELRQREYRKLYALYLKTTGLTKKPILRRRFFGRIEWMMEREEQVSAWRKAYHPP